MIRLLNLVERIATSVERFPSWAKGVFATTVASCVVSVVAYVAWYDTAADARADEAAANALIASIGVASVDSPGYRDSMLGEAGDATISYRKEERRGVVAIQPEAPYLDLIRRGGLLEADAFERTTGADLPILDLTIENTTGKPVVVPEALVAVATSRLDRTALPTFGASAAPATLYVGNEGWGPLEGAVLRFRIVRGEEEHAFAQPYPHMLRLGRIAEEREVSLRRFLTRSQQSAPRGTTGTVYGTIDYATGSTAQALHRRSVRFTVPITLSLPAARPSGGSVVTAEAIYNLELGTSGSGYARAVGLGLRIEPHSAVRVGIRVAADSSSVHRVAVTLRYGDGRELTLPPFDLELFVPRSHEQPALSRKAVLAAET